MSIDLLLDGGRSAFAPGEDIAITLAWSESAAPAWLEARLFWYTEGKGTQDVGVALRERIDAPGPSGQRTWRMRAPDQPWSCSGRLVSVRWALELVSADDRPVVRRDLVIAPAGSEITLGHVE
jgi:hypothetical protein